MTDDGDEMKEDVRIPDGGLGEEIRKLKEVDEKETSTLILSMSIVNHELQRLRSMEADLFTLVVTVRSSMGEEHVVAAKEVPRIG